MPGLNLKDSASLSENPEHLERLSQKLMELEKLGLWHEPIELSEHLATFFSDVRNLLLTKAAAVTPAESPEELASMLANAVSCVFGLAVLSGNFEHITQALETLHAFEKTVSTQDLSDKVFEKCGD